MLRIISDVHGLRDGYLEIIKDCEASLQIGDFGFHYDFLREFEIEECQHLFFAGNHDDHNAKYNFPHCLRKFGMINHGDIDFFFLEGGFSVDQVYRREQEQLGVWPKTWWENEELPQHDLEEALRVYKEARPEVLITHEPSRSIADKIGNPSMLQNLGYDPDTFTTRTGETIQRMIDAHAPKLHIFGHFHINYDETIKGVRYICQEELGYLDLDTDLNIQKYSFVGETEIV